MLFKVANRSKVGTYLPRIGFPRPMHTRGCDLPPEISARDNLESPVIERGFSDEKDEA
jgi:hypothetical protein